MDAHHATLWSGSGATFLGALYGCCYERLRTLAGVGMDAARAWENHDLLQQCMGIERDAHWWHVLTSLGIAFDNRGYVRVRYREITQVMHMATIF